MTVLRGLRVVDMTEVLMGPATAMYLRLLGAEVIRIDTEARQRQQRYPAFNAGKRNAQLNLKHPEAIALLGRLLALSDVCIYNMRPASAERLGLDYESLVRFNPQLIVLSESTSGWDGPERDYTGYAPVFAALGGVSAVSGYPGYPPCDNPFWPDIESANWGLLALLGALYRRDLTGHGAFLDLSAREALSLYSIEGWVESWATGQSPQYVANARPGVSPGGVYPCAGDDKWVAISITTDAEWAALTEAMGSPELAAGSEFATPAAREARREELNDLVSSWTGQLSVMEVVEELQRRDVPAAPSSSASDLLGSAHLWDRGFFTVPSAAGPNDSAIILTPPWRLDGVGVEETWGIPAAGQDNDYVWSQLVGLSKSDLAELQRSGVIS
jgi:crotonobetainyl-CoA:carnitine CoA-transferase CaiB-like acyl-CoA transferase